MTHGGLGLTAGYDPDDQDTQRPDARIGSEPDWRYREVADLLFEAV